MKSLRALLFLFLAAFLPFTGQALPRFALATGRTCGSCHFNPTGGQLRTNGGTAYSQEELSFKPWRSGNSEFSGEVTKGISLGGEMRMQFLEAHDNVKGKTFQQMQAALYTGVTLHERLKLYGKIDFANLDYEVFGLAALVPKSLFLKFGAFLPDYGIRMDDHTIYTRGGNATVLGLQRYGLIFPYNYKDAGIELLFTHENLLNAQIGVFNGGRVYPRFDSSFALLGRVEVTPSIGELHLSLGGSLYHHPLAAVEGIGTRSLYGGFLGAGYDRFTLTGEFDLAKNLPGTQTDKTAQAYFAELGVRLIDGLDILARFEGFDPNTDADNDQLTRLVFGAQFFPWSYLEFRPEYRINKQKRISGTEPVTVTNNEMVVQLHMWF